MSPLPRFVVLKSAYNGKYLTKVTKETSSQTELPETFLNFRGEDMESPLAKFELVTAKTDRRFVHIRCCYNMKYLTRLSPNHLWIVAAANRPVEDEDTFSCTMFQPIKADDYRKENHFRFVHVQSKHHACLWRAHQPYTDGLFAGSDQKDRDKCDVYKVFDWESIIPETVAFRRSSDKKYLTATTIDGLTYLQFSTTALSDKTVAHQIIHVSDGYVRIKSLSTGTFWKRSSTSNWIFASGDCSADDIDQNTLFIPVKLDENEVAYRNNGNQMFCKSRSPDSKRECLIASAPDLSDVAKLELVDCNDPLI
ncbi:uncharacterized protein LOC133792558 [Humulus lupulus]|uniref:uncharacterized protein LOC133792558 n=1 Tax=Humulus lupulus TaxID=3486 RepID=UPI002B401D04|nr:uncharacterized protein LOC133792558 [Humulus lupulus]